MAARLTTEDTTAEWLRCAASPVFFLDKYGKIYDATVRDWVPFRLWPGQISTLKTIAENHLVVILKARQLGLTWLALGYALWMMLFRPAATVLVFSRRDTEAVYLLGYDRLRGMYLRLPHWVRPAFIGSDSSHEWGMSNGSVARAFPTTAGDSYTASLAIVDEADLAPDLNKLMRAVKPTIDGGGRMVLLSRSNKSEPASEFKNIYRSGKAGTSPWAPVFLPWWTRPERDLTWYAEQKSDILSRTGSLDDLHEQYPETDIEAMSPKSLDKRIAPAWLEKCYKEASAQVDPALAITGLEVYALPEPGKEYVIGVDPAEGNPTSDQSALTVLEKLSGEEVAVLAGQFQPAVIAGHADKIGTWYNRASVMVERNNHGHAVLLWLKDNSKLKILAGYDNKEGWNSSSLGKTLLYDSCADAFGDDEVVLHSMLSFTQLSSIEGATLRAPEGHSDDRADSFALANRARIAKPRRVMIGVV